MKKYIIFALCIIMAFTFCSCKDNDEDLSSKYPELFESSSSESQSERGEGKLVINGEEYEASFVVYQTHAELPLVTVLEGVGYIVSWTSDTQATITNASKAYTLDLNAKSLIQAGSNENLIPQYGNSDYKCESIEKDIIVDDVTLYDIMSKLGTPINLSLDFDTLTVTITLK